VAAERIELGAQSWEGDHAHHVARYLHASQFVSGKRVLDAGTGAGYGAALLMSAGASNVQAIDLSEETIQKARARFGHLGVEYRVDDCETLSTIRRPVDLICNFENIEHLRNPDAFLRAAARSLDDAGILFCSTPDRASAPPFVDGKPANPFHLHEWYGNEFEAMLRKGLEQAARAG
jgi:O-antigen biosynthesis protein